MKHIALTVSMWVMSLLAVYGQTEVAYVQINCEPGVSVFIDSDLQGVTRQDLGGLVFAAPAGPHTLTFVKAGFRPQEKRIQLAHNQVLPVDVSPFVPQIAVTQEGSSEDQSIARQVGTLILQTIPVEATISIQSLGIAEESAQSRKTRDKWIVDKIPVGEHTVVLAAMGKSLDLTARITETNTAHYLVNFLDGSVRDLADEARLRAEAEQHRLAEEATRRAKEEEARLAAVRDQQNATQVGTTASEVFVDTANFDKAGWTITRQTYRGANGFSCSSIIYWDNYSEPANVATKRVTVRPNTPLILSWDDRVGNNRLRVRVTTGRSSPALSARQFPNGISEYGINSSGPDARSLYRQQRPQTAS